MNDTTLQMLMIKSIAPAAVVQLSVHTGQWYVSTGLCRRGDGIEASVGITHMDTPAEAVAGCFRAMTEVTAPLFLSALGGDTHYRWNGAAFATVD